MKVIFLDIDGVLQPLGSKTRFKMDKMGLVLELSKRYNIDYTKYCEYDVAAAYSDWDKDAVNRIRNILEKTDAKIVISSSWRDEDKPDKLKDFFRIYGLEDYIIGQTDSYRNLVGYKTKKYDKYHGRTIEILDYVKKHKEITNYVVIDDMDLSYGLTGHFVHTRNLINDNQMEECIYILNLDENKKNINKKKKISYEISDYQKLINENYYYVDKTEHLQGFDRDDWCILTIGPKGVGKSLFISMMYYFYDINSKDKFFSLFKDTYIYNYSYRRNNEYYVLKFNFGNIVGDTFNQLMNGIEQEVRNEIDYFCNYYNIDYKIKGDDSASILDNFLIYLQSLTELKHKIFVMIDDYDAIVMNLFLNNNKKVIEQLFGIGSVMSRFYSVLKKHQNIIYQIYITGLSALGMNTIERNCDVEDVIFDERFNDIFCFTDEEIDKIFDVYKVKSNERKIIYNDLKNRCGGYKNYEEDFNCRNRDDEVFNSKQTLIYLNNYFSGQNINDDILDNYNKLIDFVNFKSNIEYEKFIRKCFNNTMTCRFYGDDLDFSLNDEYKKDEIALLFCYYGYLTFGVNDDKRRIFKFPNVLLRDHFEKCYLELFELNDITFVIDKLNKENDIISFIKYFDNKFGNIDLSLLMYLILKKHGYKDVEYKIDDDYVRICLNDILIIFKYINDIEYDKNIVEDIKNETIEGECLKKFIVIFVENKLEVLEEII